MVQTSGRSAAGGGCCSSSSSSVSASTSTSTSAAPRSPFDHPPLVRTESGPLVRTASGELEQLSGIRIRQLEIEMLREMEAAAGEDHSSDNKGASSLGGGASFSGGGGGAGGSNGGEPPSYERQLAIDEARSTEANGAGGNSGGEARQAKPKKGRHRRHLKRGGEHTEAPPEVAAKAMRLGSVPPGYMWSNNKPPILIRIPARLFSADDSERPGLRSAPATFPPFASSRSNVNGGDDVNASSSSI